MIHIVTVSGLGTVKPVKGEVSLNLPAAIAAFEVGLK